MLVICGFCLVTISVILLDWRGSDFARFCCSFVVLFGSDFSDIVKLSRVQFCLVLLVIRGVFWVVVGGG